MTEVKQNDATFDLYYEGQKAGLMEYNKAKDGILEITHTEVADEFGGKGLGMELVKAAVVEAKKNNLKIVSFENLKIIVNVSISQFFNLLIF